MKKSLFIALVFSSIFLHCKKDKTINAVPTTPTFDAEITINANDTKQTIQGFGCATVFRPSVPLTDIELDRLFGSGNDQVGLNILRIRVSTDNNWRNLELANSKGVILRGGKILATPWSPPVNMKTNLNLIGGSLKLDSFAAYARYLENFAKFMSQNGAPLAAISIQNEPDIKVSYESCDWTAEQMRDFLKDYGNLITSTKVMASESFNNNLTFTNTILANPIATENVDIIGGHIYGGGIVENLTAQSKNKEVWMTEHLDTLTTYAANLKTAVEIHDCLTKANFSAYIWWYAKRFYGPIGEAGEMTKRGYLMSQFARFIKAGSIRVATSNNSKSDILVSAYKGDKLVIVAINNGAKALDQKFNLQNTTAASFTPYTTTSTSDVVASNVIKVSNSIFIHTLPPLSVTTFVQN